GCAASGAEAGWPTWQAGSRRSGWWGRRGYARATSAQILLGNGRAELVVLDREALDELVQARLEDGLDRGVAETHVDAARKALAVALPAVGSGQLVEVTVDAAVAGGERARHVLLEDEQVRHEPRLHAVAIDPAIARQRRD